MKELGISDPAFTKIIRECFNLLDLNVFFTVGRDECRAWPIKKNASAFDAAGKIHSDIQKGFIRAVVLSFDEFKNDPREETFKTKAVQERKEYTMNDGDLVEFRFNVNKK